MLFVWKVKILQIHFYIQFQENVARVQRRYPVPMMIQNHRMIIIVTYIGYVVLTVTLFLGYVTSHGIVFDKNMVWEGGFLSCFKLIALSK